MPTDQRHAYIECIERFPVELVDVPAGVTLTLVPEKRYADLAKELSQ